VSLRAAGPDGAPVSVIGKVFVLAGGGIENARLMLASRHQQPMGVGNGQDNVGRYFMDHPRSVWGRVRLHREADLARLTGFPTSWGKGQVGLSLSPEVQAREGLLNSYLTLETSYSDRGARGYGSLVGIVKNRLLARHGAATAESPANIALARYIYHLSPMELLPWRVYRGLATLLRRPRREVVLVNFAEQPPRRESRVLLRSEVDRFGMPLAALDWRVGEAEERSIRRLHEHLAGHLREQGLGTLEYDPGDGAGPIFTDASHHLGATRMSVDPNTGVVDADCRVHGLANLFVAGSSVFPTGGHANPMLTIVALALRLGDTLRLEAGERTA
jgi:choline dehydrogenase-like flavoprotein